MPTVVYRIVQEALTNIARHAEASSCEVRLTASDGHIELCISDDGKGASAIVLGGHQSLGIIGMKERASAIGGELTVENSPRAGVLVKAHLPLAPVNSENTNAD